MCSIVGLYDKTAKKQPSEDFFSDSFHFMKSRGPDNQSHIELDKYCSLGHQRLSIIDVGNQANQPMTFGQYTIVFNGEIYNYIELKDELKSKNIKFEEFDIWKDPAKAKEMIQRTNGAKTIPQIFVGDHYIGGNEQLQDANRSGELDKLLSS